MAGPKQDDGLEITACQIYGMEIIGGEEFILTFRRRRRRRGIGPMHVELYGRWESVDLLCGVS